MALVLNYTPRGVAYAAPTCTVDQYPAAAQALAEAVDRELKDWTYQMPPSEVTP